MKLSTLSVALGLSVASFGALAIPAPHPGTSTGTCANTDVMIGSVAASDCRGYFTGNENSGGFFTSGVKSYLQTAFAVPLGSSIIEQINTSTFADFAAVLLGDVIIGVHWGGGAGGGESAFYFFDNLLVDAVVSPVLINPTRTRGGLSNVALYSTEGEIPVPATLALLGLGALGLGLVRRRKQQS